MIHFKYNKKNILKINDDLEWLYEVLIEEEKSLYIEKLQLDFDLEEKEEKKDFDKVLTKLKQKRNEHMKEKGINVLYLVLGMLKWKESEISDISFDSPILMLPVELTKSSKDKPFTLSIFENQCIINPSLQLKLKTDFGVEMLTFEEGMTVTEYLENLGNKISTIDDWMIVKEAYLGLFSFNKIALYYDLIRYKDRIKDHPVIGNIACSEVVYSDEVFGEVEKIDAEESALESYQVLDADSSQQQAAITAKRGYSFVMQGPPGTGKSQTITNIVAECLAVGQKVLFVSEKMAALEVVKKRLEQVGLGDFCLELHSNKVNKKAVITELYSQYANSNQPKAEDNQFLYNYDDIKQELNQYIEELHMIYPPLNKSAYWLHGKLSQLRNVEIVHFICENINIFNQQILSQAEQLIQELELKQGHFETFKSTFWRYTTIREVNMQKNNEIVYSLTEFMNQLKRLELYVEKLNNQLDIDLGCIVKINCFVEILGILQYNRDFLPNWFMQQDFEELISLTISNKQLFEKFLELRKWLFNNYSENVLYIDINGVLALFEKLKQVFKQQSYETLHHVHIRGNIIASLERFNKNIQDTHQLIRQVNIIFGVSPYTISELKIFLDMVKVLNEGDRVPNEWLEHPNFINQFVYRRLSNDVRDHETLKTNLQTLNQDFEPTLLKEQFEEIFKHFNSQFLSDVIYRSSLEFIYQRSSTLKNDAFDTLRVLETVIQSGQSLKELLGYERELNEQSVQYIIEDIS